MTSWWENFFDGDYMQIWSPVMPENSTRHQADVLWRLLKMHEGTTVLDAPCGYGRMSKQLADRGAIVVGVDRAAQMLEEANRRRGSHSETQLRYRRHDLREPLDETGFDVALNLFSSIGYGSEADDIAMLTTLARAIASDGTVVLETMHRDAIVVAASKGVVPARRNPDGTLVLEEPRFDPLGGRLWTTWYWSGPHGSGQKSASIRLYCVTELIALLGAVGLNVISAYADYSDKPYGRYVSNPPRVVLIAKRAEG